MQPIADRDYEAFVQKNATRYLARFRAFDGLAGNYRATWNWSACLLVFWWFLYRRMYLWAGAAFLLCLMPHTGLVVMIGSGMAGDWLYYREARKAVDSLREAFPGQDLAPRLAELGGVHGWVPAAGAVLTVLALLGLGSLGMMAAHLSGPPW